MSDFRAIADRVEIEALRGEFTDAAMMCDYDRVASLFTPDGALRMPNVPVELVGREQIRAWRERREAFAEYFVQTAHPGTIQLDSDPQQSNDYEYSTINRDFRQRVRAVMEDLWHYRGRACRALFSPQTSRPIKF